MNVREHAKFLCKYQSQDCHSTRKAEKWRNIFENQFASFHKAGKAETLDIQ